MSFTPINAGNFFRTVDTTKYGVQKQGPNSGGNNFLEQDELKALTLDKTAAAGDQKAATWLLDNNGQNFKTYDENNDGKLSAEEANKAISAYNKHKVESSRRNSPAKPHEPNNSTSGEDNKQPPQGEKIPGRGSGGKMYAV